MREMTRHDFIMDNYFTPCEEGPYKLIGNIGVFDGLYRFYESGNIYSFSPMDNRYNFLCVKGDEKYKNLLSVKNKYIYAFSLFKEYIKKIEPNLHSDNFKIINLDFYRKIFQCEK